MPTRIRFMSETGCDFALWDDENEALEQTLPISADLRDRILAWAARGEPLAYETSDAIEDWDQTGFLLSQELGEQLGPRFKIEYHPSTESGRRARDDRKKQRRNRA